MQKSRKQVGTEELERTEDLQKRTRTYKGTRTYRKERGLAARNGGLAEEEQKPGPGKLYKRSVDAFSVLLFKSFQTFRRNCFGPVSTLRTEQRRTFTGFTVRLFKGVPRVSTTLHGSLEKRVRFPGVPTVAVRRVVCGDRALRAERR